MKEESIKSNKSRMKEDPRTVGQISNKEVPVINAFVVQIALDRVSSSCRLW